MEELRGALADVRDALARLGTVISKKGTLGLPVPLDAITDLEGALDQILGQPPSLPEQDTYLYTVALTIGGLPRGTLPNELGAAVLLALALAGPGHAEASRDDTPHSVSCDPAHDDGPYLGRADVWTATAQILAEYPDMQPVIAGPLPGHVIAVSVLSME